MSFLCLLHGSHYTSANRPYWLVSNDDFLHVLFLNSCEPFGNLTTKHIFKFSCFTLFKSLSNTENRLEIRNTCLLDLSIDDCITLTVESSTLTVTDDHVANKELLEHHCAGLTSEGTIVILRNILSGNSDRRIRGKSINSCWNRYKRRSDNNISLVGEVV